MRILWALAALETSDEFAAVVQDLNAILQHWDAQGFGKDPPSGPGGTADVVTEARRSGLPVLRVETEAARGVHSLIPDADSRHLPAADVIARWRNKDQRTQGLLVSGETAAIAWAVNNVLFGQDEARGRLVRRYVEQEKLSLWRASNLFGKTSGSAPQYGDGGSLYGAMLWRMLRFPALRYENGGLLRGWNFALAKKDGSRLPRWPTSLYGFDFGINREDGGPLAMATANDAPMLLHAEHADAIVTGLGNRYLSAYVAMFALAPLAVVFALLCSIKITSHC